MKFVHRLLGVVIGVLGLVPASALAGSSVSGVTITNLQISEAYPGTSFVFIGLSAQPTGQPACGANGSWQYTLSFSAPSASQLYAMLLTAYAAQTPIDVSGTGTCNEVNFVESLNALQLTR